MQELSIRIFIIKDRSSLTLEEYKQKFYKMVKLKLLKTPNEKMDELLEILYNMDLDKYNEFYNSSLKIQYHFINKYTDTVIELLKVNDSNYNNTELLLTALEFMKRKSSIISRNFDDVLNKYLDNYNNLTDLEFQSKLNQIYEDGKFLSEITYICKSLFEECYGSYENNPYLGNYYKEIINSIEKENLIRLENKIREIIVRRERTFYKQANDFKASQVLKSLKKR